MSPRTARLGDICEINPRAPKSLKDDATVSFLPMSSVSEDGFIEEEQERAVGEVRKGYSFFERGDVLVAKITPCFENGKATRTRSLRHPVGFGSTEFHVLRASNEVLPDYLFHTVWNSSFRKVGARNMTGSAGQKRVPTDFIKRLEIYLPPLTEQQRIVAILDKADAIHRKRKHALELLDELLQSIFLEIFDDTIGENARNVTLLSDFADIQIGFPFKSSDYVEHQNSVRLCRGANILPGKMDWSDLARWPESRIDEFSEFNLEADDVLIAMDRPWISTGFKTARVSKFDLPALLVQRVARLRVKNVEDVDFIFQLVKSPKFSGHFKPTETTIPHISPKEIRSFSFILPPLNDRRLYKARSEKIKQLSSYAEDGLLRSRATFASLQHRAFSGKL